jgi:hypothetical protein
MSDMCYDARERHLAEQQDRASGLKTEYKYFFNWNKFFEALFFGKHWVSFPVWWYGKNALW